MRLNKSLQKIIITSLSIALSLIFCRFLGYSPQFSALRFDFGFLPIAVLANLLGPVYSGIGYLFADVLGSLIDGYFPNLWISACKFVFGFIMGIAFYSKKITIKRTLLAFAIINVLVDFIFMSPIFIFMYHWEWGETLMIRAINIAITYPMRAISYYYVMKGLSMPLTKLKSSFQKTTFSKYANSFQAVSKPGLERIQRLCDLIGNPEKACKFIHVAGTNGKGSVCAYMTEILMEKGYKVGKYISPNLIKVNERISINNVDISNKDLKKTLKYLEPFADQVKNETGIAPTQFEIWTAAAFLYFQKNSCDYVVLEVGLGGELDATNVIPKNEIAIITRLGMDHMNYLGNTLSDIAKAKAGIIKKDCSTKKVITVNQDDEVLKVIQNTATENGSECIVTSPISVSYSDIYETFSFHSEVFTCGIPGLHQIENAALAVEAALVLGIDIPSIKNGISKAKNPARFELLEKGNNTILYDGGHNFNGITALVASLNRYYPNREKAVIFACMRDKEINDSLQLLHDEKTTFYFTTVKNNPRAMSEIELKEHAQEIGIEGMAFRNVNNAIRYAKKRHSLILICGSLYLYEKIKRR